VMDGVLTARALKGSPRFASIPIVLLTSLGVGKDFERELFAATLSKPVRRSQLYLTVCRVVAASSPDRVHSPVAGARTNNPSHDLHILVVEDNDVNRRVAVGMAERLGCRVDAVENGREALEALDYDLHDLVLMDVQMPELDGFEATAAIRHDRARDERRSGEVRGRRDGRLPLKAAPPRPAPRGFVRLGRRESNSSQARGRAALKWVWQRFETERAIGPRPPSATVVKTGSPSRW